MQFGRYWIEGELGRGGMGIVYRARDAVGGLYAIKVLISAERELSLQRFERERELHAKLSGAGGFVPLLEHGDSPRGPYLVMPFLPGGTLKARLGKPWPEADVLDFGRQLARAMGRAHALGVLHRDLKPDNVLFDATDAPLISDLGLAKGASVQALTQSGVAAGTVGYMPPEQFRDAKHVGPPADVFALGAILFECLAGESAFAAGSSVEIMRKVASGERSSLSDLRPDVSRPLQEVIERCLALDPADRYEDASELARALVRAEALAKARGQRSGPSPLLIAGVASAIGLGVGGFVATRPSGDRGSPPPTASVQPTPRETPRRSAEPSPTEAPPAPTSTPGEAGGLLPARIDLQIADGGTLQLGAALTDLPGLRARSGLGVRKRRMPAPICFVGAAEQFFFALDELGHLEAYDLESQRRLFGLRVLEAQHGVPHTFSLSPSRTRLALATSTRIVITPLRLDLKKGDVFTGTSTPDKRLSAMALADDPPLLAYAIGTQVVILDYGQRKPIALADKVHKHPVTAMAVREGLMITGDSSGLLLRWRVGATTAECGVEKQALGKHTSAARVIAISPGATHAVTGDDGGNWAQWDLSKTPPDGMIQARRPAPAIAASFTHGGARVWAATRQATTTWARDRIREGKNHPLGRPSLHAAIDPGGRRVVFSDQTLHTIGVVDLERMTELSPPAGHYTPVLGFAVSRGLLHSVDAGGRVIRWGQAESLRPISRSWKEGVQGRASLASLPGGALLIAGPAKASILRAAEDPPEGRELTLPRLTCVARGGPDRFLAGTEAGALLELDAAGAILKERALAGGALLALQGSGEEVWAIALEREGGVLVGSRGARLELPAVPTAFASLGSGWFAVGDGEGRLALYSRGGPGAALLKAHPGGVSALAAFPGSDVLYSAGLDETVATWRRVGDRLELLERKELATLPDRITAIELLSQEQIAFGSARGRVIVCERTDSR